MNHSKVLLQVFIVASLVLAGSVHAAQQVGARGQIQRMIVNHNPSNDEIYITTTTPSGYPCPAVTLHTNDPNVSPTSYKTLYAYLLTAKATGKTLEFYTDGCNLFRLEMVD